VCFAIVAMTVSWLPADKPVGPPGRSDQAAAPLKIRPPRSFVALGLVNGVLTLHVSILEVALPLWILHHTSAPAAMVPIMIFINTVVAVAFQVVAGRHAETVSGAARTLSISAFVVAAACILFAATGNLDGAALVAGLVLAVVVLTFGELTQSAGAWGVSFGLSSDHSRGRHLGAFSVGTALQDAFGPALIALLVIDHAPIGWWSVAAALAAGGGLVRPLIRAAERAGARAQA
jgi:hypothetical protein